jgi:hypothetical protein
MLDHPIEAGRMATAAQAHIGGRFSPDVFAGDLAQAYELAIRFGSERRRHEAKDRSN